MQFFYIRNKHDGSILRVLDLPYMGTNSQFEQLTEAQAHKGWADLREAALLAEAAAGATINTPPVGDDDLTGTGSEPDPS